MSNNTFTRILDSFILQTEKRDTFDNISLKELQDFEQEYTFIKLRTNLPFGEAFCKRFNLLDFILISERSHVNALNYIKKTYIK